MQVTLSLGSIIFQGFEVPERMPFGGSHMLVVKRLVGGDRIVDAMGRDEAERAWSGRFRGIDAEARARALDQMRISGQQQLLTWSSFRYLVVIERFQASYEGPEIPYSISCTVIQDLSAPILAVLPDADTSIGSDLSDMQTLGGQLNVASVTQALTGVAAAASLVSMFQGASVAEVSGVQTAIGNALTVVNTQQVNQNTVVAATGSVAGMVGGKSPIQLSQTLTAQSSAFSQLGQLYQLQALLGRASVNVTNAGS